MLLVFGVVSGDSFPDCRFQASPSQHFFCRHAKMLALGVGCPVGELSERSDTEDSLLSWLRHGWRPAANRARRLRGTGQQRDGCTGSAPAVTNFEEEYSGAP